jgi:hypothetical protein
MADANHSKSSNLARIRDNQRRSRARRKEYLQELEAKIRNCEQMGVTASTEIQSAARKVLDENRKLRALLRERGVPETEIMAITGASDQTFDGPAPAPMLATMLNTKKTCSGQTVCANGSCSEPSSIAADATCPPIPVVAMQGHDAELNYGIDSTSPRSLQSSSINTPPFSQNFSHASVGAERDLSGSDGIPQTNYLDTSWTFPDEGTRTLESNAYANSSSCTYAANIIRTMREDVGAELEADLGCRKPGQDCMVNNTIVFTVMEKYGNPPCGI